LLHTLKGGKLSRRERFVDAMMKVFSGAFQKVCAEIFQVIPQIAESIHRIAGKARIVIACPLAQHRPHEHFMAN
jgi:hypothetical protein